MIDKIVETIAPHHCYFCQKVGHILCESCIYNITIDDYSTCIVCGVVSLQAICGGCNPPFQKAWMVAAREGQLSLLINDYKWQRKRAAYKPLAMLLHATLPQLPKETVVVPIPTISRHIRVRGYDHCLLIAKEFCRLRKLHMNTNLERAHTSVQHTAGKKLRSQQAERAFQLRRKLDPRVPYLVIDDIVTTASTMQAATRVLKRAEALEVWVAAIARQPL